MQSHRNRLQRLEDSYMVMKVQLRDGSVLRFTKQELTDAIIAVVDLETREDTEGVCSVDETSSRVFPALCVLGKGGGFYGELRTFLLERRLVDEALV